MEKIITSPQELQDIAAQVIDQIKTKHEQAAVLALHGELGAGKTTFVRVLAQELGIAEEVRSPTYLLIKSFALPKPYKGIKQLVHIDAYRVEDSDELTILNFPELLKTSENLIVVEWAEKIKELLPDDAIHMQFKIVSEEERDITISNF